MRKRTQRQAGRPRDLDKRDAIIAAGWAHFLEHGVGAARIEAIAKVAGVSKVTLYKYFPDKAALFEAAIKQHMAYVETLQAPPADRPLEETLERFGVGLMLYLASKEAIDFYNVLSGELRRHPAIAQLFYDNGPGKTHANLTTILAAAVARGELAACEPAIAAEELFGLWQGLSNFQLALGVDAAAFEASVPARVRRGITLLMLRYGAT